MSFTGEVLAGFKLADTTTIVSGATVAVKVTLPDGFGTVAFANGTGAQQVNLGWIDTRTYSATPTTLDLAALAAASTNNGAAAFAKLKVFYAKNNATTAGYTITIGAAASNAFAGPLGGTGPTITLGPGEACVFYNLTSGGWTVDSTHKDLKVDPGANNISFTLGLLGNA